MDRYRIVERLGGGAEGVIFRAYDPQLEREVALKFPRFQPGADGDRQRARLLREAEALARLSHPNVVALYDVVVTDDELCLVCEYVRGQTVTRWLSHLPRTPRQIASVFREAGRGLAAVHDAGLVHRDFKPDNVIVGRDGRVRVVDFGLARTAAEETEAQTETSRLETTSTLPSLTLTGALVGTPLYMSPEQHHGAAVDARSDQWAFCMALAEALLGRYPLPKSDLQTLSEAKHRPIRLRELPPGVPKGWRRPLERGLRRDPARRFESMGALLTALDRPAPPLRRRLMVAAGGLGLATAAVATASAVSEDVGLDAAPCEASEGLDAVWNGARRRSVKRALTKLDEPHVADTFDRAQVAIDRFTTSWWMHWNEACASAEAGRIDGDTLRAQQLCLDALGTELDATLSMVERSSSEVSRNLLVAIDEMGSPGECGQPRNRARWRDRPGDRELAVQVDAAYRTIGEAIALQRLGEHRQALERLEEVPPPALQHRPLRVELAYHRGSTFAELGRYHHAVLPLSTAFFEAESLGEGYEWIAWNASMVLAEIHAVHRAGTPEDARTWLGYAEAMSNRASPADPLARANVELLKANALIATQRFEDAIDPLRRVVAAYEQQDPRIVGYRVFGPRQNLAVALLQSGREDEAIRELMSIVDEIETTLGPSHPALAPVLLNLGSGCEAIGDFDCTAQAYERLEPLVRHYHAEASALTAAFAHGMGGVQARAERFRLARRHRADALEAAEAVYGPWHVQTAMMMFGLAEVELELGELTTARARLARAREMFERELGPDNSYAAAVEVAMARVEFELGHWALAEQHARAAENLAQRSDRGTRAPAAQLSGRVALQLGQGERARRDFARALRQSIDAEGLDAFETRCIEAELGAALAEVGDIEAAAVVLGEIRGLASSESFTPRQRAKLQLRAAEVAHRLDRLDDARALIDEATRQSLRFPGSTETVRREISRWRERTGL